MRYFASFQGPLTSFALGENFQGPLTRWGRNSSFLLAMLAFKHVSSATTIAPSNHFAPFVATSATQMHFRQSV